MTQTVNHRSVHSDVSSDVTFRITAQAPGQRRPAKTEPPATADTNQPVQVLYDGCSLASSSQRPVTPPARGTGYLPYRFDIADLFTVGSEIPLPELDYFREPRLGKNLDIEVRVGKVGKGAPRAHARLVRFDGPAGLRYEEHLGRLGANFSIDLDDKIRVTVSGLLAHSPHVAYTNILEALLRYMVAAKGAMLLHSACVQLHGEGLMLSARTDTGKTGTVLRMLREHGAGFLSDDMTILWPDATAQAFPKPMTISSHTLRAVDPGDLSVVEWMVLSMKSRLHSKSGRGIGMRIGEANLPVMTANAITQMLVPPPKYGADRLVPCEVVSSTQVRNLFVIERGEPAVEELDTATAVPELMANTDDAYGFPPYRYVAPALVIGGEEFGVLRRREQGVLNSAVDSMRARRLKSNSFTWADDIPRLLADSPPRQT